MSTDCSPRLLFVEDHLAYRNLITFAIQAQWPQVQVIPVASLAEARECLNQQTIQIILTDMNLEDGTAVDLLRETAAFRAEGGRTIICSNHALADIEPVLLKEGCDAVVCKAAGIQALLNALRQQLSGNE
jgi:two-component system, NtrC family, response regulator PilR